MRSPSLLADDFRRSLFAYYDEGRSLYYGSIIGYSTVVLGGNSTFSVIRV
ncbi:hypothetical protein [Brasilonema bromeliae]|nr:hypothetical protein [Brasilonema bromeliae]